jgi:hypothetical protein
MRSPPASTSRLLRVVAGFQVSISGRFWVSTEETLGELATKVLVGAKPDMPKSTLPIVSQTMERLRTLDNLIAVH